MVRTTRRATGRGASLPPAWLAILAIAGLVLLLAVRQAPPRALAQEAGPAEGIAADITGTYDIRPDEPAIGVKWQVDLENTGPSPWSEPGDPPTYLDSIEVFVQGDSSTFQASGPADERLSVSFLEFGSGYAYVTVQLGRTLEYGDKYSLTYSYRITSTDENRYSLRPSYVSIYAYSGIFPIDTYRSSTLFVTVPLTYSQHTLVGAGDCSRSYKGPVAVFECRPENGDDIATDIEIVKPGARAVTARTVPSGSGEIKLTLTHFVEDQTWADHLTGTVAAAIPVLEEVTGVPYPGPLDLRINERARQELWGYAGMAGCYETICGIGISPASDDQILLHELAHIWTHAFFNRWLSEGTAEFLSIEAAELLGLDPSRPYGFGGSPPFALETWDDGIDFTTASQEAQAREYAGYNWSALFFLELEQGLGPETVRQAYTAVIPAAGNSVDSKDYLDALEDAGGGNNDDLFLDFIFTEKARPLLSARRDARDRLAALTARSAAEAPELSQDPLDPIREAIAGWEFEKARDALGRLEPGFDAYLKVRGDLAALRAAAEEAGLAYPVPFENALTTWDFAPHMESIADAGPAIDAYRSARESVSAPRSLWQRIGLYGKNPEAQLREAAGAFAWADFDGSIEKSRAAEATVDGAAGAALKHGLIAAGVLVTLVVVSALLLRWALRDEPAPASSGSDA